MTSPAPASFRRAALSLFLLLSGCAAVRQAQQPPAASPPSYSSEHVLGFTWYDYTYDEYRCGYRSVLYLADVVSDGSVPHALAPLAAKASSVEIALAFLEYEYPLDEDVEIFGFSSAAYGADSAAFAFSFAYASIDPDAWQYRVSMGGRYNYFPSVFAFDVVFFRAWNSGSSATRIDIVPSTSYYDAGRNVDFSFECPIALGGGIYDWTFGLKPALTWYRNPCLGFRLALDVELSCMGVVFLSDVDTAVLASAGLFFSSDRMLFSVDYGRVLSPDTGAQTLSLDLGFKF
ncbi:MAG: hypothetical protein JW909_09840 [Planctomycetes bacterium]|nr:hypothetical protein [Planctomycetota bacterium]